MKKLLTLILAFALSGFSVAQSLAGVCINNVAQTISNGVIAPIPLAAITLCTAGSTAANCRANIVQTYTSAALTTTTPPAVLSPFIADAGGNYFFCAVPGHYALNIGSAYGSYFVPDIALAQPGGSASTASASDHAPVQCSTGSYATGVTNVWAGNCAQVQYSQLRGTVPTWNQNTIGNAATATSASTATTANYANSAGTATTAGSLTFFPVQYAVGSNDPGTSSVVCQSIPQATQTLTFSFPTGILACAVSTDASTGKTDFWYQTTSWIGNSLTVQRACSNNDAGEEGEFGIATRPVAICFGN